MPVDSLEGISTDSIIVMTDPAVAGSSAGNMGWLRSLPFLNSQGISEFTFSKSWLSYGSDVTFDEVLSGEESPFEYTAVPGLEFKYHLFDTGTKRDEIASSHICQFVSQEVEDKGQVSTTRKLIRAYNEDDIEEFLLVVDTPGFRLNNQESDKPLTENLNNVGEFGYEGAARYYIKHELPTNYLSFEETMNIWLHEAAIEYADTMGQQPARVSDLFAFSELDTNVRTWDLFEFLASQTTRDETAHIQATVRPWVERDITRIRRYVLNELQEFDFDAEEVRAYREEQNS